MPKVSVITPVYADISQKVDWLDEMIQSVISQSMVDWELIIVDDKSPLPIPLQNTYSAEPRIRWFQNDRNYGPPMTRNTAVGLMESDCILPLDADDLLANENILEYMYDAWIMDKSKIIYGHLQQLLPIGNSNHFEPGKKFQMGKYTFEGIMNLGGLIPVTAMHSIECWHQSGGWKDELKDGLEDVEYWIFAGEQGFCGHRIEHTTLLYRRHEKSRTYDLKHGNLKFTEMQNKIKSMHDNIYQGKFPMSCCGGKGNNQVQGQQVAVSPQNNPLVGRFTVLEGYPEKDKIWVEYDGDQKGSFDVIAGRSANVPPGYHILGKGHKFEVHIKHEMLFRQKARQKFITGVQDPRTVKAEEDAKVQVIPQVQPSVVEVPKPQLSTIVRIDEIASKTKQVELQPFPEEISNVSLDDLMLSPSVMQSLKERNYTIERLASETIDNLIKLPNIGTARASQIIAKAGNLM